MIAIHVPRSIIPFYATEEKIFGQAQRGVARRFNPVVAPRKLLGK